MAGQPKRREQGIAKLREIGIDTVLERVADGKLYRDIAAEFGVTTSAVSEFLYLDENKPLLAAARKAGARAHVEIALTDAEAETDPRMAGLQKLRADMRMHLARSDDPDTWSEKKNLQVSGAIDIQQLHLLAISRPRRILPGRAPVVPEASFEVIEAPAALPAASTPLEEVMSHDAPE